MRPVDPAEIDREVDRLADALIADRRHLHAHPEPSREEFGTARFLAGRLAKEGIPATVVAGGRGILAGPGPIGGRCVAIRADIDALRIEEATGLDFRSTRPGLMHACGHDAHAAMGLAAAIAAHRLVGDRVGWRAVFQPAEEVGEGAAEMIAAGALDGVDAIVALHVDPERPVGRVGVRSGVLTAHCVDVRVTVRGRGGHAARPHLARDPIAAAAHLVTALYAAVPRSIDSRDAVVLTFGAISGGTLANVIPESVDLRGTLRTLGPETAAAARGTIARVCRGVADALDVAIEPAFEAELVATVNDPDLTGRFARVAASLLGPENVDPIPHPSLGGEDFGGFARVVPGCMLRLGVGFPGRPNPGLHNPRFEVDERALPIGAKLLARALLTGDLAATSGDGRGPAA